MPVMPRTFITCKGASLSKSVECESLSLFVGRASSWVPIHRVYPSRAWWSGTLQDVYRGSHCILFQAWVNLAQRMAYCLASQGAEVMIGNSVLEQAATHNQTLPTITVMSMLAAQDHWCIWFFGPDPYQLLPMLTILSHAVIGDSGTLETRSTNHYHCLPTF